MVRHRIAPLVVVGAALMMATAAPAQDKKSAKWTRAQALFKEGVSLFKARKYTTACKRFEASLQLVPGLGTRGRLAECYQKIGRLADAWQLYHGMVTVAVAQGDKLRERVARKRAARLQVKIGFVVIDMDDVSDLDNVSITDNGNAIDRNLWQTPLPADPGTHVFAIHKDDRLQWSIKIEVRRSRNITVIVPQDVIDEMRGARRTPPARPPASQATPASSELSVDDRAPLLTDTRSSTSSWRTWGKVTAAVGVGGLIAGGALAGWAYFESQDVQPRCPGDVCTEQEDQEKSERALRNANRATYVVGAGALITAVGVALWWLGDAPDASSEPQQVGVSASPNGVNVWLQGRF